MKQEKWLALIAVPAIIGLGLFIWLSWTPEYPLIDVRPLDDNRALVLKDRKKGVELALWAAGKGTRWRVRLPHHLRTSHSRETVGAGVITLRTKTEKGEAETVAFRLKDGSQAWRGLRPGLLMDHRIVMMDHGSYADRGQLFEFYVDQGRGLILSADQATGRELWRVQLKAPRVRTLWIRPKHLIFTTSESSLVLLDRESGRILWQKAAYFTPCATAGAVYYTNGRGFFRLHLASAREERLDTTILGPREKGAYYSLGGLCGTYGRDLVLTALHRKPGGNSAQVLGLDPQTLGQRWRIELKGENITSMGLGRLSQTNPDASSFSGMLNRFTPIIYKDHNHGSILAMIDLEKRRVGWLSSPRWAFRYVEFIRHGGRHYLHPRLSTLPFSLAAFDGDTGALTAAILMNRGLMGTGFKPHHFTGKHIWFFKGKKWSRLESGSLRPLKKTDDRGRPFFKDASLPLKFVLGLGPKIAKGRLIDGHTDAVHTLTYSRDGSQLFSASRDGTVKLWQLKGNGRARILKGRTILLAHAAAISPDWRLSAWNSWEYRQSLKGSIWPVVLFDNPTKTELNRFDAHRKSIDAMAFSPDSRLLATAGAEGLIKLWDPRTGVLKGEITAHGGGIKAIAFNKAGDKLASGGSDGMAKIWNPKTGALLQALKNYEKEGYTNTVNDLAWSPDSALLATACSDRTVQLWDALRGKRLWIHGRHRSSVERVAFAPSGKLLASAGYEERIHLWNPSTGKILKTMKWHFPTRSMVFHPSGRTLAIGDAMGLIALRDISSPHKKK